MKQEMAVTKTDRLSYNGGRQFVISSRLCGLLEPIDCGELMRVMRQLTEKIDISIADYIIGLDSAGIIPALAASMITGLPLKLAYKMNLNVENKIRFAEPHSPNPDIYLYNLPVKSRVILVDDEIRTGKTIINCINSITESGSVVNGVIVPLESTRFDVRKRLSDIGYNLVSYVKHYF